ncbi:MAG: PilZ domain-containing protein [Vicinamibacterales bacterium]
MPRRSVPPSTSAHTSERAFPRLQVEGRLLIAFAEGHNPAWLMDISLGGFAIQTAQQVQPDEFYLFWLSKPGEEGRLVSARAVYCTPMPRSATGYASGWAANGDEATQSAIEEAVAPLTSKLHFDL